MEKKTLVLGASPNPERFSNRAIRSLLKNNVSVVAVGIRCGNIDGVQILKPCPELDGIHTVTLYLGPQNQPPYYDYILKLSPRRVIFNPGTENPELEKSLKNAGIEVVRDCTLVMLANDDY